MSLPSVCGALSFSDVTVGSGLVYDQNSQSNPSFQGKKSGGAAPGDFDNDGWVDLYVTRIDKSNILYRNKGDGTFEDVTVAAFGVDHLRYFESNGCGWADIDNDGDLDLYVLHLDSSRYHLFINDGAGGFTEEAVARGAAVQGSGPNFGTSIAFGDYDLDGYLDFYVTEWRMAFNNSSGHLQNNRLFHNRGAAQPGYFDDVTAAAGVATDGVTNGNPAWDSTGYAPRFSDMDRDGLPDLLLTADSSRSRLWWNNGDGTFTDGTVAAGVGTDHNGMGSALGDYDLDGDLDWFVTAIYKSGDPGFDGNRLYRYDGGRTFTETEEVKGVPGEAADDAGLLDGGWGWAASFCDFDHDGDLDLMQTNGAAFDRDLGDDVTRLFQNNGSGVFTNVAGNPTGVTDDDNGKGLLSFDYDRDGDMDVFIVNCEKGPVLYRNNNGTGDWLQIRLEGRRSNRQGIGAFVTVQRGGGAPILVREMSGGSNCMAHDEYLVHFGLGTLVGSTVDSVVVEWPSGVSQTLTDAAKNGVLNLVEPELVARVAAVGGGYELSWNGCKGWSYDVETCVDLSAPAPVWTKVGDTHEAAGPGTTATVPASGWVGYYRVVGRP